MILVRKPAVDALLVAAAMIAALVLGFANLGVPSLWHDEAVQVLVAKSIAETGRALLPSGQPHPVAPVFNAILALFVRFFGDSEATARSPAVLFAAVNVILTYLVARPLVGRGAAILAAFALALSPWSVAWSRQARFYTAQQTFYLVAIWAGWRMVSQDGFFARIWYGIVALGAYALGVGSSLHSLLFLGPVGAYSLCMLCVTRQLKSRWTAFCAATALAAGLTVFLYWLTLPERDAEVIFMAANPIDLMGDPDQTSRLYYVKWLLRNLGGGFFILFVAGSILMVIREKRGGLYAALAVWVPLIALSLLIGYRRHRFFLFAFPFYTMAFSYGIVVLSRYVFDTWTSRARASWFRIALSVAIVLFGLRLCVSAGKLVLNSIEVARGANTTLATRHPQYRTPCLYVRERLTPDTAVITDTYVCALYYIGRVDDWFPSKYLNWEDWETGKRGLWDLEALKEYIAAHPKGYFLAEWYRFQFFEEQKKERDWVNANMKKIAEGSCGDVTLYSWGM